MFSSRNKKKYGYFLDEKSALSTAMHIYVPVTVYLINESCLVGVNSNDYDNMEIHVIIFCKH